MTSITVRATEEHRHQQEGSRAREEHVRAGPGVVDVRAPRPRPRSNWLEQKFGSKQEIFDANVAAFKAGYNFGETTELFAQSYQVERSAGRARDLSQRRRGDAPWPGAWSRPPSAAGSRCSTRAIRSPRPPSCSTSSAGTRTSASCTLQAEDEIAAANMALGAAFAGQLAVTGTSGPGMDLKAETLGLAVIMELPMIVVDVQRAGPSTGMPTKTEQADLLLAMFGRHGESPMPIVAASSPSDCFDTAIEAARIAVALPHAGDPALRHVPVELVGALEAPRRRRRCRRSTRTSPRPERRRFMPYLRDEQLARPWAMPGHAGPRAPDRRPRDARTAPATSATTPQPRAHDPPAPGQGRRHRRRHPGARGRRPRRRRRAAGPGLGLVARHDPARRHGGCAMAGQRSPRRTCATSTRSRRTPATSSSAYPQGADPRDEHGPAVHVDPRRVPGGRHSFTKVQGLPIFADDLEQEILRVLDE